MRPAPRWPAPLAVALVVLAAFAPTLRNGFVNWDDPVNFIANPHYRGLGWENLKWMFASMHFGMYQPMAWLTLACDYLLWGMDPRGYHLTSLLIHAANAVLFYFVVMRLIRLARPGAKPGDDSLRLASAFAALLFAVHPLRVECVAWITERRDMVSGFFYLATVLLYLERRALWAVLSAFILALLAKGMVITLPAVLLVLDFYPLRRLSGDFRTWLSPGAGAVWLEKLAFLPPALAIAAAGYLGQAQAGEIALYEKVEWPVRLAQSFYGLVFYAWKTLLPSNLAPLYPRPANLNPFDGIYVASAAAVIVAAAALIARRQRYPAAAAAAACYALTLSPVLGLIPFGPQIVADRYTYLACLGAAALAGGWLYERLQRSVRRGPILAGAGLIVASLSALTFRQTAVWRDTETLWSHAAAVSPRHAIARNFTANALLERGRLDEAEALYREALRINPSYGAAHNNLGNILSRRGRNEEALVHYRQAARLSPGHKATHFNWGVALLSLGRRDEAARQFEEELRLDPSHEPSRSRLEAIRGR